MVRYSNNNCFILTTVGGYKTFLNGTTGKNPKHLFFNRKNQI